MCCGIIVSVRAVQVETSNNMLDYTPPIQAKKRGHFITDRGEQSTVNKKVVAPLLEHLHDLKKKKKDPLLHILSREVNIHDSFLLNFGVCCCTQTHSLKKIL